MFKQRFNNFFQTLIFRKNRGYIPTVVFFWIISISLFTKLLEEINFDLYFLFHYFYLSDFFSIILSIISIFSIPLWIPDIWEILDNLKLTAWATGGSSIQFQIPLPLPGSNGQWLNSKGMAMNAIIVLFEIFLINLFFKKIVKLKK